MMAGSAAPRRKGHQGLECCQQERCPQRGRGHAPGAAFSNRGRQERQASCLAHGRGRQGRSGLILAALAFCVAVIMLALPQTALADYSIDKVDIDATVQADGSVKVVERRTYTFDDEYNGVYWEIPTGATTDGRTIQTAIDSVGVVPSSASAAESAIPFDQVASASNGMDGVYEATDEGNDIRVKLYHPVDDETVTFQLAYTDSDLAARYQDVSELYWKFVSDGWDVESQDVTCAIHLPVPDGATVVHDGSDAATVRAWGHGPLDATVSIADDGTVTYQVPGVGTSEYAEARIVFPAEWLSGASIQQKSVLPTVLAEERQWADEANARRSAAQREVFLMWAVIIALAVASIAASIALRRRYKMTHAPQFDDQYFRDVPTGDHPAVLGALLRDGTPSTDDLTASLMRLTDEGYVRLEKVSLTRKKLFGRTGSHDEYVLTRTAKPLPADADGPAAPIDRATMSFLFDGLAPLAPARDEPAATQGQAAPTLWMSDIEDVARAHSERYAELYEEWSDKVAAACIGRRFFVDDHRVPVWPLVLLMTLDVVATMGAFVAFINWDVPGLWYVAAILACAGSLFACQHARRHMPERSSEAIEVTAKLEALRRWLRDFTRLKEAVPSDVVLWNRLLVMAVVLGVSDEVIRQLKVAAPQMLEDPRFLPAYSWYYLYTPAGSPFEVFNSAAAEAHKVSQAAVASSSFSSAGGGGGGFSAGGGGGFGGGGGGGAF